MKGNSGGFPDRTPESFSERAPGVLSEATSGAFPEGTPGGLQEETTGHFPKLLYSHSGFPERIFRVNPVNNS